MILNLKQIRSHNITIKLQYVMQNSFKIDVTCETINVFVILNHFEEPAVNVVDNIVGTISLANTLSKMIII